MYAEYYSATGRKGRLQVRYRELLDGGLDQRAAWEAVKEEARNEVALVRAILRVDKQGSNRGMVAYESELVDVGIFGGRSTDFEGAMSWVAANVSVSGLSPSDAPSAEAWSLLRWVRESADGRRRFWSEWMRKAGGVREGGQGVGGQEVGGEGAESDQVMVPPVDDGAVRGVRSILGGKAVGDS